MNNYRKEAQNSPWDKSKIDTERNISIGLLIDVGENQIATSVRRDVGEDSKLFLFPALHDFAIGFYTATVHIRSTFDAPIWTILKF